MIWNPTGAFRGCPFTSQHCPVTVKSPYNSEKSFIHSYTHLLLPNLRLRFWWRWIANPVVFFRCNIITMPPLMPFIRGIVNNGGILHGTSSTWLCRQKKTTRWQHWHDKAALRPAVQDIHKIHKWMLYTIIKPKLIWLNINKSTKGNTSLWIPAQIDKWLVAIVRK